MNLYDNLSSCLKLGHTQNKQGGSRFYISNLSKNAPAIIDFVILQRELYSVV